MTMNQNVKPQENSCNLEVSNVEGGEEFRKTLLFAVVPASGHTPDVQRVPGAGTVLSRGLTGAGTRRRHLPADTIASIYWLGRDHLHHHRLRARGPALDTLCMSSTLHRERRAAVLRSAPGSGAVVGEDSETKETLTGSVGGVKSTITFRFCISAGLRYDSSVSQCHKFDSSFKLSRR